VGRRYGKRDHVLGTPAHDVSGPETGNQSAGNGASVGRRTQVYRRLPTRSVTTRRPHPGVPLSVVCTCKPRLALSTATPDRYCRPGRSAGRPDHRCRNGLRLDDYRSISVIVERSFTNNPACSEQSAPRGLSSRVLRRGPRGEKRQRLRVYVLR
jgi:hypothetical protein